MSLKTVTTAYKWRRKVITQTQTIKAKTFMGLLAAEGLVPHTTSANEVPEEFFNKVDREIAAIKAPGMSFFELMVEAGQMKPASFATQKTRATATLHVLPKMRITRPYNLGGEMPRAA